MEDGRAAWSVPWDGYAPPEFTSQTVLNNGRQFTASAMWADPPNVQVLTLARTLTLTLALALALTPTLTLTLTLTLTQCVGAARGARCSDHLREQWRPYLRRRRGAAQPEGTHRYERPWAAGAVGS